MDLPPLSEPRRHRRRQGIKRKIDQRARHEGIDRRDVKTGHGGIRDIEFVIQFLQLLNGGELPAVRTGNTLEAISRLAANDCLTLSEAGFLEDNYTFLRKLEHLLQIMLDLQTHTLPDGDAELKKLAIRMGYTDQRGQDTLEAFKSDFQHRTSATAAFWIACCMMRFRTTNRPSPKSI